MLIDELKKKKQEIEAMALQHGAKRIRVFGSVARKAETANSDIDFLVNFSKGYDLFKQRLPLIEALSKLTGRKVDIVPEHELNNHIRDNVLQEAQYL